MSRICDEFSNALKKMVNELESNGPVEESLSSFIGNCAGVPVDEKELISDVQKGLKSYEMNMNDFCTLGSIVKRPQYTQTYLAPLDDDQLKGFKLLPSQEVNENVVEVAKVDDKIGKPVERKYKRKQESKHHIILTLKRTETNVWKSKEQPQKIVPIYTERISGKPTERNFNSFK